MAFGDDFDIRNQQGQRLFFVNGKAYTFAEDLRLLDTNRQEIARIRQKLFTLSPTYNISQRGTQIATVRKKILAFRPSFTIKMNNSLEYQVKGNLFLYNYRFYQGRQEIARVSKKILAIRDFYSLEILSEHDPIPLLCSAIVIDMVLHKKK